MKGLVEGLYVNLYMNMNQPKFPTTKFPLQFYTVPKIVIFI